MMIVSLKKKIPAERTQFKSEQIIGVLILSLFQCTFIATGFKIDSSIFGFANSKAGTFN